MMAITAMMARMAMAMTVTYVGGNLLPCATVSLFAALHAPADASSPAHRQNDDHDGLDDDDHDYDDIHGDYDDYNIGNCLLHCMLQLTHLLLIIVSLN